MGWQHKMQKVGVYAWFLELKGLCSMPKATCPVQEDFGSF
ncbi:hypothetical protein HHE06_03780 [Helicobacter heilmannii]|nr:hypothetical protein HHE06_03780 [Helicobacter heilmannii]